MTTRRGFLAAILAAGAAPAAVASGVLMPVRKLAVPEWVGVDLAKEWADQTKLVIAEWKVGQIDTFRIVGGSTKPPTIVDLETLALAQLGVWFATVRDDALARALRGDYESCR